MKKCQRCNLEKPDSAFGLNTRGTLRKRCFECEAAVQLEYKERYKAKKSEYNQKWFNKKPLEERRRLHSKYQTATTQKKNMRRAELAPMIEQKIAELLPLTGETFYGIASKLGIYELKRKKYNTNLCVYLYLCVVLGKPHDLPEMP